MKTLPLIFLLTSRLMAEVGNLDFSRDYFIVQLDNDVFAQTDQGYTNGIRLGLGGQVKGEFNAFQKGLKSFTGDEDSFSPLQQLTAFEDPNDLSYDWGFSLTQLMFTATNPRTPFPGRGERPYAGWLGMEFSLHAKDENALSSVALSIGITGEKSLAHQTQDAVHRLLGGPLFNGWDTQVPEEVTLNIHLDRKVRFSWLDRFRSGNFGLDGYFEYGVSVGNFRTASYAGTLLRVGYNLPIDYSVPRLQLASYSSQLFRKGRGKAGDFSCFLMAGVRGSAIAHDISLDGPLFRDFAFSVDTEPLVGEFLAGLGVRYRDWELTYAKTFRTREFKGQLDPAEFGSFQLSYHF